MSFRLTAVHPNTTLRASVTVAALVVASLSLLAAPAQAASGFTARAPILIEGNAGFTAANGVSAGNGTPSDPYVIGNWSIDASGADGIVVRNTTASFAIHDVLVYSGGYAYDGIVLDNVSRAVVRNATLTHDASGLVLRNCANVSLLGNAVLLNTWNGVDLLGSRDVYLNGNTVSYNRDGLSLQGPERVRLAGNSVWMNTQDGAYVTDAADLAVVGGTFASNDWSGFDLVGGRNITLYANQFSSNGRLGVFINAVDRPNVSSNVFFSNPGGSAQLVGVTNATVNANAASPAGASGIIVESAHTVRITRNSVSQANYSGILLGQVDHVTIDANTLSNNDVGVGGVNVTTVEIGLNTIATNSEQGVSLIGSKNLTLTGNNVSRNGEGIVLDAALDANLHGNAFWQNGYGVSLLRSTSVVVVNNSFVDNAVQAYGDGIGANRWDGGYPVGGNYWSDYVGVDLCSGPNQTTCIDPDGFGDTPYAVSGSGHDDYPLMRRPGSSAELPVASFVIAPLQGNTSTVFVFDATSSYDLQNPSALLLVRWDLDGDGVWDTDWTTNRTATHRYLEPATYAVHLEVLDTSGLMSEKTLLVVVLPVPPPPASPWARLLPALVLLIVASALLAIAVYRRIRANRPAPGHPAWRLRERPRR